MNIEVEKPTESPTEDEKAAAAERRTQRRRLKRIVLSDAIKEWRMQLESAVFNVENVRRIRARREPYPPGTVVWIPLGPNSDLQLLTLKVWCRRFCVTPEFLMEALMHRFRSLRKAPSSGSQIYLGLSATTLTNTAAYEYLEEQVHKTYPNGENYRMSAQPPPPPVRIKPYTSLADMVKHYDEAANNAQEAFHRKIRILERIPRRSYRRGHV